MSDEKPADRERMPFSGAQGRAAPAPFVSVRARYWHRAFTQTAVIAGVFSAAVAAVLVISQVRSNAIHPLTAKPLEDLKEQLAERPNDPELKAQIRKQDFRVRHHYFRHEHVNETGAYLLIGGLVLLIASSWAATECRKRIPQPLLLSDAIEANERAMPKARWATAAMAVILAAGLGAVGWGTRSSFPLSNVDLARGSNGTEGESPQPSVETEKKADSQKKAEGDSRLRETSWPRFRGPGGRGIGKAKGYPVTWDSSSGKHIVWSATFPLPGVSSPVLWGNRLFLTGASAEKRAIYCTDSKTGKLLWTHQVSGVSDSPKDSPTVNEGTGYAAPTAATDGKRVFALFANGDLVGVDFSGDRLWAKNLGIPKNNYGHASSLVVAEGRLLVQYDQGYADDDKSILYAFEPQSGRLIWQRDRSVAASWATPIVIDTGDTHQVLTASNPWLISYGAKRGRELWRAEILGTGEVVSSPSFGGGRVVIASPYNQLYAVRPDGKGEVTETHVEWSTWDGVPSITTPLVHDGHVFTLKSGGMLSCLSLQDGSRLWSHDLGFECYPSPVLAGDRLYVFGSNGEAIVVKAAEEYKQIGQGHLHEKVHTTPVLANGRLYVRGAEHLYCIGTEGTSDNDGTELSSSRQNSKGNGSSRRPEAQAEKGRGESVVSAQAARTEE